MWPPTAAQKMPEKTNQKKIKIAKMPPEKIVIPKWKNQIKHNATNARDMNKPVKIVYLLKQAHTQSV